MYGTFGATREGYTGTREGGLGRFEGEGGQEAFGGMQPKHRMHRIVKLVIFWDGGYRRCAKVVILNPCPRGRNVTPVPRPQVVWPFLLLTPTPTPN